jgi:hypothetical protein
VLTLTGVYLYLDSESHNKKEAAIVGCLFLVFSNSRFTLDFELLRNQDIIDASFD